jgi:hypothetical protein
MYIEVDIDIHLLAPMDEMRMERFAVEFALIVVPCMETKRLKPLERDTSFS